jgi:hypothetical protein
MIEIKIDKQLEEKGINVVAVSCAVQKVSKRRNKQFEEFIKNIIGHIDLLKSLSSDILLENKKWYSEGSDISPAEHLLQIIKKTNDIPNINNVVDLYNAFSAKSILSIGAHDIKGIKGVIRFVPTNGFEKYTPLGKSVYEKVEPGKYACMDDEKILCYMDIKQCDETKITSDTKEFILYIQGNKFVSKKYILNILQELCDAMKKMLSIKSVPIKIQ